MRGTEAFLLNTNRPRKRELQLKYYQKVAEFFNGRAIDILDMPSLFIEESIELIKSAGIHIKTYTAIEKDPAISQQLSEFINSKTESAHSGYGLITNTDVLELQTVQQGPRFSHLQFDFINMDFCSSMGQSYKPFHLPHQLKVLGKKRIAFCLTFSPRSPSRPIKKADHALRVIAPQFYDLDLIYLEQNNYKDTSAMCSWLAIFRKK